MSESSTWRQRSGTLFGTYKEEVVAAKGVVVSNHPLASAAGMEMLARGGNAADAAVATAFALSVVEPMMVGIFGAGFVLMRNGRSGEVSVVDNYCVAPLKATPDMFEPAPGGVLYETVDRRNEIGYLAVGVPGALKAWAHVVEKHGNLSFAEVIRPAIGYARYGFRASPYLVGIITLNRDDLARFPATAEIFLPNGAPPKVGDLIVRTDYANTLEDIGRNGPDVLYEGWLGRAVAEEMAKNGGLITLDDLANYQLKLREPVRGTYRGHEIVSVGPTSSGGAHIIQVLNILEGFDVGSLGFGTPQHYHLFAETLKIAFADRQAFMGDPDVVQLPLQGLIAKEYAAQRRKEIDLNRAGSFGEGDPVAFDNESKETTHLTVVDGDGNVVAMTQTIHATFGAKVTVPGTGVILNNTMNLFDPHPGRANSIVPGKRMLSSMSPTIVLKDGKPFLALGTPGATRIFPAVLQSIINVVDHGMTLQEAIEAPRVWTMGAALSDILYVEPGVPSNVRSALAGMGHPIEEMEKIAGGMCAVQIDPETGMLHGSACWRADGVPMGYSGGWARPSAGSSSGV